MATELPTVLIVDNRPGYFVSHRLALAKAARDAGYDVHVSTLTSGDPRRIRDEGFTFHPLTDRGRSDNLLVEVSLWVRLAMLIRRLRPGILHLVTLRSILYGGLANRVTGNSAVLHAVTGLGYLYSSDKTRVVGLRTVVEFGLRFAFRQSVQKIVFQNPDDERLFRDKGLTGDAETTVIPGSGVDTGIFRPSARDRVEKDTPPLVVCPTRMLWQKGVGDFVEAARRLERQGVEARFALVGDTDADNPGAVPRAQLDAWEEEDVVEWLGYRDDMPRLLQRSSVVCFPSRYREGVPKVLLEAGACALPAVTTDIPGCRLAVEDGVTGFAVPPGNSTAVAEALERLLRDEGLRQKFGRRARERIEARFTLEQIVEESLAEYDSLLERQTSGVGSNHPDRG